MESGHNISKCLLEIYMALEIEGYNPIGQITGYILSGDPTYITAKADARKKIQRIYPYELLEELLKFYFRGRE